ncbi:MAG TPA: M28 family metallopeptidase [Bacteroidota bacterium]
MNLRTPFSLFCLLFLLIAPIQQDGNVGAELYRTVQQIEGLHDAERLNFIKGELAKLNVAFHTMPFDTVVKAQGMEKRITGENIIIRMGNGAKHLVVGAHSDAVPISPGANDNGGGVAVLLGLIKTLKAHQWNVTVDFVFFDREEDGLVGSAVYVRESPDKLRHLAMINLDVEGTGEEVYVGPVGGGDDDLLMPVVRTAAKKKGFPFEERAAYPSSDYQSFARAKLENISISVVPKGDADKLAAWMSGTQPTPETFPEVMKIMHTARDSAVYVTPKALGMSYEFTKTIVLLLNDAQK